MSPTRKSPTAGLIGSAALFAVAFAMSPARATPEGISLLQTVAEWQYPGSNIHGAEASDGGNPDIPDAKMKAILTTPEPFEAVARFYAEKAGEGPARAVAVQEDSKGRPVALRVFSVHQAGIDTTLVISRGEGEKETHIAWSQYRRFSK